MLTLPFRVTNEEIEPICNSMDIWEQNTALSIASWGCIPVAFASFWTKTHAVDNSLMQLSQAIQRTWLFANWLTEAFLKDHEDGTVRWKVNRDFMSWRAQYSERIERLIQYEEGDIFDVWYKNLPVFDRIYLSNAYWGIPRKLVHNLQKTPSGTLIYTSHRWDFEAVLSVWKTIEDFQKVFAKDDERTEIANKMTDPFWNPVVYKKID